MSWFTCVVERRTCSTLENAHYGSFWHWTQLCPKTYNLILEKQLIWVAHKFEQARATSLRANTTIYKFVNLCSLAPHLTQGSPLYLIDKSVYHFVDKWGLGIESKIFWAIWPLSAFDAACTASSIDHCVCGELYVESVEITTRTCYRVATTTAVSSKSFLSNFCAECNIFGVFRPHPLVIVVNCSLVTLNNLKNKHSVVQLSQQPPTLKITKRWTWYFSMNHKTRLFAVMRWFDTILERMRTLC